MTACSYDSFEAIWAAFDASRPGTETVRVDRGALADMIQCGGGMPPLGLVVEKVRNREGKTVEVYREKLWLFLSRHRCFGSPEPIGMRAR